MTQIFISYAHVDNKITKELAELLSDAHYDVWYDPKLKGGDKWWEVILAQIKTCDHFIFLISPKSIASKYCQKELTEAMRLSKHIIPIRIRERTFIPKVLESIQYIDSIDEITLNSLTKIHAALNSSSENSVSSELIMRRHESDLKLLRMLWPLINSKYLGLLLGSEIEFEKIDTLKYQKHISNYLRVGHEPT